MHYKKHGFTIIEVSLVLAIAGLILVMAFIALPALQRQARDSQRKEDTMTFLQALKKFQQDNRGNLPQHDYNASTGVDNYSILNISGFYSGITWADTPSETNPWVKFYNHYLNEDFKNPDGNKYSFLIQDIADESGLSEPYNNIASDIETYGFQDRLADFYIFASGYCENGEPQKSSNSRNIAIVTLLETGTYCADM